MRGRVWGSGCGEGEALAGGEGGVDGGVLGDCGSSVNTEAGESFVGDGGGLLEVADVVDVVGMGEGEVGVVGSFGTGVVVGWGWVSGSEEWVGAGVEVTTIGVDGVMNVSGVGRGVSSGNRVDGNMSDINSTCREW